MSTVILNGDQIYTEELIRENARLTVQHTADLRVIDALSERAEQLEAENKEMVEVKSSESSALSDLYAKRLVEAQHVIEWLMAGGDPCRVCSVKCLMGTGDCKPQWTGNDVEV